MRKRSPRKRRLKKRSPRKRRLKKRSPRKRRLKSRRFSTKEKRKPKEKRKRSELSQIYYGPGRDYYSELLPVYDKNGNEVGFRYNTTIRQQGKQNKLSELSTFVPLKRKKAHK